MKKIIVKSWKKIFKVSFCYQRKKIIVRNVKKLIIIHVNFLELFNFIKENSFHIFFALFLFFGLLVIAIPLLGEVLVYCLFITQWVAKVVTGHERFQKKPINPS